MNPEFWQSSENHVAASAVAGVEAESLAAWATKQGMRGWCFFQTSGSEGRPKWVALAKESFLISGRAVNAHFEVSAQDRWLIALPLHHVGGFSIQARALLSGSTVVRADPKWHPESLTRLCATEGITLVSLVPAQVHDLVSGRFECPPSVRVVIVGGGGMSQELAERALSLGWPVFQSYGMTEAGSQIATQTYHPGGPVDPVDCLEVLPHWQVDADADGRLILRGAALARGYACQTASGEWEWQPLDAEQGWRTRDFVRLWQHGSRYFLRFVGRESGQVKILGELLHLAPLQTSLEALAVRLGCRHMPALMPLRDERRGCRLALVCAGDEPLAEALFQAYNDQVDSLRRLHQMVRVAALPRTPVGKLDFPTLRHQLRQEGWETAE